MRSQLERRRCASCNEVETVSVRVDSHECFGCGSEIRRSRHDACGTSVAVTITAATVKERAWDYRCTCGQMVRIRRSPRRDGHAFGSALATAALGVLGVFRVAAPTARTAARRGVPTNSAKNDPWAAVGPINAPLTAPVTHSGARLLNGSVARYR